MAQPASTAPRDQSMDEILASIRRIIEDSEPAAPIRAETEPSFPQPANDAVLRGSLPYSSSLDAAPAPETYAPQTVSLLGVQDDDDVSDAVPHQTELETVISASVEAEAWLNDRSWEDTSDLQPVEQHATDLDSVVAAAMRGSDRQPILSDYPGRQVSASFEQLSDAYAASRRRSFDEMAEDMLRPMLQDWLDNNLPTLVERLVREEIERVARGA